MSIPNFVVRNEYVGNNTSNEYTFDFKITDLSQIIIQVTNADFTPVFRVRGDDTTFLDSVTFEKGGGGTVDLKAILATGQLLTILLANDQPVQLSEFKNKADFTLKRFEDALDYAIGAIDRLAYLAQRSWKIGDNLSDNETFDASIPINSTDPMVQNNVDRVIVVGQDNKSLALGPTATDLANDAAIAQAAAAAASTSEANAAISASQALAYQGNASVSAANAAASDADAINQATAAAASAASIVGDVALANAAAAAAALSATNAASSAMAAASSATAAAAASTAAAGSAINANTYATNAAASATASTASAAVSAAEAAIATAQAIIATNAAKPIPEFQMTLVDDQDVLANIDDGMGNAMSVDANVNIYVRFAYSIYRTNGSTIERRETGTIAFEWVPMLSIWRIADRRGSTDALGTDGDDASPDNIQIVTAGKIGQAQYTSDLIGQIIGKMRWKFEQKIGVET